MSKAKTRFICQECGAIHQKWVGRCDSCLGWNTIVEEVVNLKSTPNMISSFQGQGLEVHDLTEQPSIVMRKTTQIPELDRVLGGGLVSGSALLIGGDPGIGKSTLLLQVVDKMSSQDEHCLYISGEESAEQIKLRADRLGIRNPSVRLACGILLRDMIAMLSVSNPPSLVIIDSIQTIYHDEISSAPGTVTQVRSCAFELIQVAKKKNITLIFVGHVTKDGQLAGPKVLEHMVDAVLYFEGENGNSFRIVRAVKNRFGAAGEIGVFEMSDAGLSEVMNPSSLFLSDRNSDVSGVSVFAGMEGTRPILIEVQALIVPTFMASPRRSAIGWDNNRLAMLIAVLNSRCGLNLLDKEVYLNFTGGIRVQEPAADMAVVSALISAALDKPIDRGSVFFGEIGLSGEIRRVSHHDSRVSEAEKLGFKKVISPEPMKNNTCKIVQKYVTQISELKNII